MLQRAWEVLRRDSVWPAPWEAAQRGAWLSGSAGNRAAARGCQYQSRLRKLLRIRHPEEYQAWAALGPEQQLDIQAFVRERAPAVLEEANQQQVAPLHTPEARAKYAQYREDERAGKQADVPPGHKRCLFAHKPKQGITCDKDSKPLSEFTLDNRTPDGREAACGRCKQLYDKVRPCLSRCMCVSCHGFMFDGSDSFAHANSQAPRTADLPRSDRCTAQVMEKKREAARVAAGGAPRKKRNSAHPLNLKEWEEYLCEYRGADKEPRMPAGAYRRCSERRDKQRRRPLNKPSNAPRCPYAFLPATDKFFYFNSKDPDGLSAMCRACNKAYCDRRNAVVAERKAKAKAEAEAKAKAEEEEG